MSSSITFGELIDVANKGYLEATEGDLSLADCWDFTNDSPKNPDGDPLGFLVVTEFERSFESAQLVAFTVDVPIAPSVPTYSAAITRLKGCVQELNAVINALENGILNETLFNPVLKKVDK